MCFGLFRRSSKTNQSSPTTTTLTKPTSQQTDNPTKATSQLATTPTTDLLFANSDFNPVNSPTTTTTNTTTSSPTSPSKKTTQPNQKSKRNSKGKRNSDKSKHQQKRKSKGKKKDKMSSYNDDDDDVYHDSDSDEGSYSEDDDEDEVEEGKPRIEDHYTIGKEIGRGAFSIVKEATHKKTGEKFAVKSIRTRYIKNKLLMREIEIMKKVGNHPNILKLYEVFETKKYLYLVLELVNGGELFERIVERGEYSEKDASNIVRQIVSGVAHLHLAGVAHRDLKPQNLLCAGTDGDDIRVADFGLSKIFGDGENLETCCGSPEYVAPEVLECKPYNAACDLWSVGVITYVLLTGCFPFWDKNNAVLYEKIRNVDYGWPEGLEISAGAKHLIENLIVKLPEKRFTADQVLQHPWIVGTDVSTSKSLKSQAGNIDRRNKSR